MEVQVSEKPAVLIVDDNPLILNVLKTLLGSQDFQVKTAKNGREALQLLEKEAAVDVIVCDVMMPKMDGYALHTIVREKAEFSHIPFVFLTALDGGQEIRRGKEAGADDYLTKPFEPEQFLAVVRGKVVRSRRMRNQSDEKIAAYKKRVIHTLSHEFRTPLVAINTGTEILLEGNKTLDQQKSKHLIEAIARGGQRLERLVGDFLVLQQIEAGVAQKMWERQARKISVMSMIEIFRESVIDNFEKEGFATNFSRLARECYVWGYEAQLLDALKRIAENAIKFSTTDKKFDFVPYVTAAEIFMELRDRGMGLDLAKIREAIDVFGQINREKLEQQGSGLGLAIASKFVEINKGRLDFARRSGGGSVITIALPLYKGS